MNNLHDDDEVKREWCCFVLVDAVLKENVVQDFETQLLEKRRLHCSFTSP